MELDAAWAQVLAVVERWAPLGIHEIPDWRRVGHTPDVGAAAYLHVLFPPLSNRERNRMVRDLRRDLPPDYDAFLTRCANGAHLFADEISLFGDQRGGLGPYDLVREQWDAPDGSFALGAVGDGQRLLLDESDGSVRAGERSWSGLATFLVQETDRLAALYDPAGRRREPLELAPEDPLAESVERVVDTDRVTIERIRRAIAAAGELADFELVAPEVVEETGGGARVRHVDPALDELPAAWLPIGSTLTGDPILVDLASPELRVFTIWHDAPDVDVEVAARIEDLGDALRARDGEDDDPVD